jgi:shikimate kinase
VKINRIYLAGFMASGKSTIGPILANVLGWDYYDLDCEIEKREAKKIVDIFEENGEEYFRTLENNTLNDLSQVNNIVVSLGGGTMAKADNLKVMKSTGKIVFLETSPEEVYNRLKNKTDRPLVKDLVLSEAGKEEFIAKINKLLSERQPYYSQADININTDTANVGRTVDQIKRRIIKYIDE